MKIDVNIVKQAKQGNQQSFTELYDIVAPSLYKLALYTLGNQHDAEDVVSETFIEAYKGISKLRDEAAFKPWITRILTFRCKRKIGDYIKQRNVYDIDDFLNLTEDKNDLSISSSDKISVSSALNSISYEDRQIVLLSVLQGYTTKEISDIMSMPHGTVSSKLYRALKKMRQLLEETE
ncbi:MAG: RNA polymerase sigma factor [Oscillospiraceae bacterium]